MTGIWREESCTYDFVVTRAPENGQDTIEGGAGILYHLGVQSTMAGWGAHVLPMRRAKARAVGVLLQCTARAPTSVSVVRRSAFGARGFRLDSVLGAIRRLGAPVPSILKIIAYSKTKLKISATSAAVRPWRVDRQFGLDVTVLRASRLKAVGGGTKKVYANSELEWDLQKRYVSERDLQKLDGSRPRERRGAASPNTDRSSGH
ncbi:hypothetical protein B0H17DRAFT_1140454 [Mycena rosella]|uniref:Uncharacterized protein n=1 Tax=Mycena rosella TaxID=1033263 RepID=A0AAD7G7P2_MYCRO|nr:hypothetical protein B0H17DRAFT_1140454 [Mycena rosella]